jgi:hypothetical protein
VLSHNLKFLNDVAPRIPLNTTKQNLDNKKNHDQWLIQELLNPATLTLQDTGGMFV